MSKIARRRRLSSRDHSTFSSQLESDSNWAIAVFFVLQSALIAKPPDRHANLAGRFEVFAGVLGKASGDMTAALFAIEPLAAGFDVGNRAPKMRRQYLVALS